MRLFAMCKDRGSVHSALMGLVIQDGMVNHTSVVPNHEVTDLPPMAVYKLNVLTMCVQISQDGFAFSGLHAINVRGVCRADVQRFSA